MMSSKIKPQLSERLNQISPVLQDAEALFSGRFWAPANVPIGDPSDGARLWYKKLSNQYRLVVELQSGMCPVFNASVQYRTAAAAALEMLWAACEQSEIEQTRLADEAYETAVKFLEEHK